MASPPIQPVVRGLKSAWAFWFGAILTAVVFLAGLRLPGFTIDSWSYLELSSTIFRDFYHINTIRQVEVLTTYSNAFPPLWPILIAVARRVADLGIYTGYLLNLPLCLAVLALLMRLFRKIGFDAWVGATAYLALLGFTPFLQDALTAKNMSLSIVLLLAAVLIFLEEPSTFTSAALAALLMGLACLNRFDALPAACVIGAAFAIRAWLRERRPARAIMVAALYFVVLGAVISPWAAFGMKRFGKPFPSADARGVLMAKGANPMDYYQQQPPSDLSHHPHKWLLGLALDKAPRLAYGFYLQLMTEWQLQVLLAAVVILWGGGRLPAIPPVARRYMILALVLIPVIMLPALLVGYRNSRYYSASVLLFFTVLLTLLMCFKPVAWTARRGALLLLAAAVPLFPAIGNSLYRNTLHGRPATSAASLLAPTPEMRLLNRAIRRDSAGQPHILVVTIGPEAAVAYGALTGEPITLMPDIKSGTFATFARDWHVTHVYNPPDTSFIGPSDSLSAPPVVMAQILASGVDLIPLDMPGLYRIRPSH